MNRDLVENEELELAGVPTEEEIGLHPLDYLLRTERLPHIWCPGCGLGTALSCFSSALVRSGLDLDKVAVVSGIGCTGRVAGICASTVSTRRTGGPSRSLPGSNWRTRI